MPNIQVKNHFVQKLLQERTNTHTQWTDRTTRTTKVISKLLLPLWFKSYYFDVFYVFNFCIAAYCAYYCFVCVWLPSGADTDNALYRNKFSTCLVSSRNLFPVLSTPSSFFRISQRSSTSFLFLSLKIRYVNFYFFYASEWRLAVYVEHRVSYFYYNYCHLYGE